MTTYIVTFEVNNATRQSALEKKLKEYESYCPIHNNCWAIISDETPLQILNFFDEVLSAPDRVFIIRSGTHAAWVNSYGTKHDEWLKDEL